MNEEALNDTFNHFKGIGYPGSVGDFSSLLSSNQDAFNDAWNYAKSKGYPGTTEDFSKLLGLEKTLKSSSIFSLIQDILNEV